MILTAIFEHWRDELEVVVQACVAIVFGGLVGWEREAAGKLAGLRTHMLVCLASMLFVRLGQMLIVDSGNLYRPDAIRADPVHVIAAIATGISFIGAGAIFRDAAHEKMRGLTTAASLLATASIGVAIAINRYIIAAGIVLLVLFVLHTLHKLAEKLRPRGDPPEEK